MSKYPRIEGIPDILPNDHEYFTHIKKVVRYHARRSGMKRVTLPAIESAESYRNSLGVSTDIVEKEMFLLTDENGKWALRPDYTTGMARAYIENNLSQLPKPLEYYYIDHCWRKGAHGFGKYQQFLQFGFEIIGEQDPALDAQLIEMCANIYSDLTLKGVRLRIHTMGSREVQMKYGEELKNFYMGKERSLCADCVRRLEADPIRLLDCKEEDCKILAEIAPKIDSMLDTPSKDHHKKVKEYLSELGVEFEEDSTLVRGTNYYTHTIFEFFVVHDGEEVVLGGGGRYDTLIEEMGGEPTPALGFASGMERITELMKKVSLKVPSKDAVDVFVVQLGDDSKRIAMKLVSELRKNGVKTMGALGKAAIRAQLDTAKEFEVAYALVIGQMEVVEKKIIIRDMKKGTQEILPMENIVDYMVELLGPKKLDTKDFKAMVEEASEID